MSIELKDGGPAFPLPMGSETTQGSEGMTLRDYFAAKAMQGLLVDWNGCKCAEYAYEIADQMLKKRGE